MKVIQKLSQVSPNGPWKNPRKAHVQRMPHLGPDFKRDQHHSVREMWLRSERYKFVMRLNLIMQYTNTNEFDDWAVMKGYEPYGAIVEIEMTPEENTMYQLLPII